MHASHRSTLAIQRVPYKREAFILGPGDELRRNTSLAQGSSDQLRAIRTEAARKDRERLWSSDCKSCCELSPPPSPVKEDGPSQKSHLALFGSQRSHHDFAAPGALEDGGSVVP